MQDPREPNNFDFPLSDDSPLNTGNGYNRDEDDLYLDDIQLDEPLDELDLYWYDERD